MLNGIASAIPATLMLFFVEDRLQLSQDMQSQFLGVYFLAAALSLPLWLRCIARVGLRRSWLMGMGLAWLLDWNWGPGLVFGLALSVASTVVLLKALEDRGIDSSHEGHIAVGWLIVEDLVMVVTLVLLPALSGALGGAGSTTVGAWDIIKVLAITLGKVVAFAALMLVVGRRVIPWMLERIVMTGSRELFRLGVLATALGVAYGATVLFGVSFALGAFFAGMVLAESPFSQRAAEESLPLRDAFAVLFFVSVGMLLDPWSMLDSPALVIGALLIVLVGKPAVAVTMSKLNERVAPPPFMGTQASRIATRARRELDGSKIEPADKAKKPAGRAPEPDTETDGDKRR